MTITIPKSDYRWLDATPAGNVTPAGDTVALFSMAPLSLLATQYGVPEFIHDVAVFSIFWLILIAGGLWMWHVLSAPQSFNSSVGVKQFNVGIKTPHSPTEPATEHAIEWTVSANGARVPIRRKTNAQK